MNEGNALPADFYKYLDDAIKADSPFSSAKSLDMRRWNAKQKYALSFYTQALANDYAVANARRVDLILTYNVLKTLQKTGLF